MKADPVERAIWITGAIVMLILVAVLWASARAASRCERAGGMYVSTFNGHVCADSAIVVAQ